MTEMIIPALLKKLAKNIPPIRRIVEERDRARQDLERYRRLLGYPPGHFYSHIPEISEVRAREDIIFGRDLREIPGLDLNTEGQLSLIADFVPFYKQAPFNPRRSSGLRYYYENDFYSCVDALYLYCMLRRWQPGRIIEIGAGFSSAVVLDTSERFFGGGLACTFIEPFPDRLRSLLRPEDEKRVTIIEDRVQNVDVSLFGELSENDVLFIDSSHVSKIDSDVNHVVFEILPNLHKGVLIHIHDVFYPFEYPKEWIYEGRFWNEAYILRAFLQFNSAFEIVLFADYLYRYHRSLLVENLPLCAQQSGGCLWLRRR